jgi:hypothetical protein
MIFYTPDPATWTDPGPLPHSGLKRQVWRLLFGQFSTRPEWVAQWKIYLERVAREQEEYQMWLDSVENYELLIAEYQAQGEHMAEMLPIYLHHMGLSYRRTVQDRKHERPYERVEYCEIEHWFFDEYAYYFWLQTWPLPYGVRIAHFQPVNSPDENSEVADTLSAAFGSRTITEFNGREHDRPGLWIIVEHKAGRGKIPMGISYEKCLSDMPKGAKPLSWPMGQGSHSRSYIVDLGEITNLLIGGSQGGGKSNIMNVILTTLIQRNTPNEMRLFLADFKRVEFAFYRGIPHLGGDSPYIQKMTPDKDGNEKPGPIRTVAPDYQAKNGQTLNDPLGKNIITDGQTLIKMLEYALSEIDRRTDMLEGKVKKLDTWNKRFPHRKLARWIIVIDELADVMLQPMLKKRIEPTLVRIAQLGRAMGVHLILATQTPKNEVVSLLIQNNIINRVVFRCGTGQASGVMLDGLYDAARLPQIPGRCIFREGARLIEMQTPEITDLAVRTAVKNAKLGQTSNVVSKERSIAAEKLFNYALSELDGYCGAKDLHGHFRTEGVAKREIDAILKEYQVQGSPPALEPELELGPDEDLYYLAPAIVGSRTPRRLIPVDKFIAEFDEKWADVITAHGSQNQKTEETVTGEAVKISKTQQPQKAVEL